MPGVRRKWVHVLCLTGAMFLWGSSFVALKIAFTAYDPMVVIFARMLMASVCFLPFFRAYRRVPLRPGDWKAMLFMGLCEPGLYFLFEAQAVQYTTASQAGMITTTLPLIVALAAALFLGERASRQTLLGFAVAIAGAFWLSAGAEPSASAPVFVVPIYVVVFMVNAIGAFDALREWTTRTVSATFIPVEALSVVALSFAAEFTSGFAAAGALMDAGVLTVKQTVTALLIGNVVAFPIRALRHQLPRYMGIFAPKMGAQLLLMGQGFRVASIVAVGALYYAFF